MALRSMSKNIMQKLVYRFVTGLMVAFIILSSVILRPLLVNADENVVTTYINEVKLNTRVSYRDPSRRDMLGFLDRLGTCLNTSNNWQTGNVTTVDQLKTQLQSNDSHPCASEYTTVTAMRDGIGTDASILYPTVIRDARRSGLTSTVGTQMRDNADWTQKFEAYFTCLMTETSGVVNWQSGSPVPTTAGQLGAAVRDNNQHPCHSARAELEAFSANPPASAAPSVSTSAAPVNQSAPSSNSSISSGSNLGSDNRPIFDRIVPPKSSDVLTPGFATQDRPSISSLVNFLFDFLVRRLLPIIAGVLVIVITWGGYQYIMAQGDSSKTKQAKDTILFGIIGLVLAMAALSIVTILNNILLQT